MLLNGAGLAASRLALLDVPGGHQPVSNQRGEVWSVFNGELYNHRALRTDLQRRGHRFRGHCDSELIPALFEEWGAEFVTRLRGMFALAVYDQASGELHLARDPFGVKPLYYRMVDGQLHFASEVRALLAGETPPAIDETSVWHYLSFGYVPDPGTMWREIAKVPPGHRLSFQQGQLRAHRYWHPTFEPDADQPWETSTAAIGDALTDSVSVHLDADVPVGVYLSSGVDSSLIAALATHTAPLKTFTVGFRGSSGQLEELAAAREMAELLGAEHREELVSAEDYCTALPTIAASQEEPLADPSAPALWFLARAAGREVKAVLSGEGADELFAGYPIYQEPRALRHLQRLPDSVRNRVGVLADQLPERLRGRSYLQRGTSPLERRFLGNSPVFSEQGKRLLFAGDLAEKLPPSYEIVAPYYDESDAVDEVAQMQTVSCQTWLPGSILAKADKMSMAHSVEVRVPFLDREVFEVARTLPLSHRLSGGRTKVALRTVAERTLPEIVAQRPKLGFPVPFRAWLDGPVGALLRDLVAASDDPLLDRNALRRLVHEPRPHPARYRQQWSVLSYLLWRQTATDWI